MKSQQLLDISINQIDVLGQVRETFSQESLLGLAQTLREQGVRQPIVVRPNAGRYDLLIGERRLRAAKLAGLSSIPAIVDDRDYDDTDVLTAQLTENLQREDLTPIEKAHGIQRIMQEKNWSATRAAAKLGLSQATVSRLLALLLLPVEIQQQVGTTIPASSAYEITKIEDMDQRAQLANEVAQGDLTRDSLAARRHTTPSAIDCESPSRVKALLDAGRSVTVSGTSLTLGRMIDCLEELVTKARRARRKGLELTTFLKVLRDEGKVTHGNEALAI